MSILPKLRKRTPSRQQINIEGVRDGILMLPRNHYLAVIEVSPINFELKSDEEQDTLIDTYQSFLNSLPCPIQILVRIRELDMDRYLTDLAVMQQKEPEPAYKRQLSHYSRFVQRLVHNNRILSRRFYIALPYHAAHDEFDMVKEQLSLMVDMVSKGLARLGIQAKRLDSLAILDLFHTFYNPTHAKQQPLSEQIVQVASSLYTRSER